MLLSPVRGNNGPAQQIPGANQETPLAASQMSDFGQQRTFAEALRQSRSPCRFASLTNLGKKPRADPLNFNRRFSSTTKMAKSGLIILVEIENRDYEMSCEFVVTGCD